MREHMPPDDDPIIRSLRDAGIRPLPPKGPSNRFPLPRAVVLLIAIVLVLLGLVPFLAGRLADWLWYREIGFERVFLTKVVAQWVLGVPTALVAFAVLYGNARFALRGAPRVATPPVTRMRAGADIREAARVLIGRGVEWLALPATAVVSVVFGLAAASQWRTLLQAAYGTPFGVTDSVFGRDVGYYVFTLPAIELVTGLVFGLLLLALVLVVLPIHVFRGEIEGAPRGVSI